MKKHDIFLSHAREDKEAIVEPLSRALDRLGVKVWYDVAALSIGDSLTENIDRGLTDSIFGAVVRLRLSLPSDGPNTKPTHFSNASDAQIP